MWKVFSFYNNFLNVEFLWNFDIKQIYIPKKDRVILLDTCMREQKMH